MSVVKINAITVPRERFDEFAQRFAARAGRVSSAAGFEAFELLRPNDGREVCLCRLVAQHRTQGPVGTGSELWSFDVLEREEPRAG